MTFQPKAYCFDLDGTLIDSEVIWVSAIRDYLVERIGDYTEAAAFDLVYGHSWADIHQTIVRQYPSLAMPIHAMEAAIAPYYKRIEQTRDVRIHSSIQLLERLALTHPVCIVSGSSTRTVQAAVSMLGIDKHLQFILGADDYAPGKPDPICYRIAAMKFGVPASACVVFEDSQAGVRSAKAAGMRCVAIARPGRPAQDLTMADMILEDLGHFVPTMLAV
jgi:HAD superfamily hydrolase (TIGR01509 family)